MRIDAGGIRLDAERLGDPGAPAFLLIRGLGTQRTQWPRILLETLVDEGFQVLVFDNRDCGLSHKASAPDYDLDDMAADSRSVLDAFGVGRAHWVGISMGGMIAQLAAERFPQRCASLASVMSSSGAPGLPGPTPEAMEALLSTPEDPDDPESILAHGIRTQRVLSSPGFPPTEPELRAYIGDAIARSYTPDGVSRQVAAIAATGSRVGRLERIRVPTLVVHGDADPLIPLAAGEDTAARIPGARLEVIAGMAHDVTAALAPRLAGLLVAHARRAEAGAGVP